MILSFIDDYFLHRYKDSDFVIQQKVRVLSTILIFLMVLIVGMYSYHLFLERTLGVLVSRTFGLVSCIFLLALIRKGYFHLAGHLSLSLFFTAIWMVMFLDHNVLLTKMDTIALVIGLFSSCALILDKNRWLISVYWLINIALLSVFCFHIVSEYNLSPYLATEYFADNFIALLFVGFVSYHVITINTRALDKANESIQIAESEVTKNKTLNETLELKVLERTERLSENNEKLQQEIAEREKAESRLREAQQKLVENAHKAGMAEIASDTLHNVGNILNSIKTSAYIIEDYVNLRTERGFSQACALIREHRNDLEAFIVKDPRGSKTIDYFLKLDEEFRMVFDQIESNIRRLNEKVDTIANVILAQQNLAGTSSFSESANLAHVIEDALAVLAETIEGHQINVIKEFQAVSDVIIQKTKMLHTFVNLFKNAVHAMSTCDAESRLLKITLREEKAEVIVEISDTGSGVSTENQKKIFNHGFTTKKDGFGFGLHSCANYLNEMGASIAVQSEGENQGAVFILKFPIPLSSG